MTRLPRVLALAGLLVILAAAGVRAGSGEDPREQTARAFYAEGKYQEAIVIFAQMFSEKPHPNHLFNIGRCYLNLGDPDKGIASFREYLRKSPKLDAASRREVEGYIKELEQLREKHTVAERSVAELASQDEAPARDERAPAATLAIEVPPSAPRAATAVVSTRPAELPARAARPVNADPVGAQLAAWRAEGETLWQSEARHADDAQIPKIEGRLAKASPDDPRFAEYQLRLAGLYAASHFGSRLKANAARKAAPGASDGTSAPLNAEANRTFLKAVEAYVAASRVKSFGRQDEVLYQLALILSANNLESKARVVLTRLVRVAPDSKLGRDVRLGKSPEAGQ